MRLDMWLFRSCPLLKACNLNKFNGFDTYWRGIIVGPVGIGVLWRMKGEAACICTQEEINQFGTPDPLCKALKHPLSAERST